VHPFLAGACGSHVQRNSLAVPRPHISGSRDAVLSSHAFRPVDINPTLGPPCHSRSQHVAVTMYPPFDYFEHQRAW
jgi:hypothetical protein